MTIGFYQQQGGAVAAAATPTPGFDATVVGIVGANPATYFSAQDVVAPYTNGVNLIQLPLASGETLNNNGANSPTWNTTAINGHPAVQIDDTNNQALSGLASTDLVNATEWTMVTVAKVTSTATQTSIVNYNRGSGADQESVWHECASTLSWQSRFQYDNGAQQTIPYNAIAARDTVLLITRRSAANIVDFTLYDIGGVEGGAFTGLTEAVAGSYIFTAQPTVTFGDTLIAGSQTYWIGEHWMHNARITDANATALAIHYLAKWS